MHLTYRGLCFLIFLAAVLLILSSPAAQADDPAGLQNNNPTGTSFSTRQIEDYVTTKRRIQHISNKWISRVQKTQNQAELQQIQAHIRAEMEAAIRKGGLTADEYYAISRSAQKDPKLKKAIDRLSAN
ncbi:MAG: DUF4168 domain-containing protein [Rhodospirillales bacterium]